MLRRSLWLFVALLGVAASQQEERYRFYFESGVRDYRIGSYYDALNEFNHLAKYPENPYYLDALKYLAKTYLQIGKRTGEKRYLWSAQNFLNTYLAKGGSKDEDYYYTKAYIFEVLGFYERALANYKIALRLARKKPVRLEIVIGILRSAVWLKKLDLATRYIVILSIEHLSKEQRREFQFLQGMYYFVKGEYGEALDFLKGSYREYEHFLIENPEYYYIVAENAYRLGDLPFAERLFRRILNYIKNKEVIQKSLLRLGDIKFLQNLKKASASYYYQLVKEFPDSPYATIAKLKLLYLMDADPGLAYYIQKFLPDAPFLQDPQKFVVQTLVANRNNYVGFFALANFGRIVLQIGSEKLVDRLGWELSLVATKRLQFEHKEYFRRLWKPLLLHRREQWICKLYEANPDFFFAVFDRELLLDMATGLKGCTKGRIYMDFLERLAQKYPNPKLYLELVELLFHQGSYKAALEYLGRIGEENCQVLRWRARICFMQQGQCPEWIGRYVRRCRQDPFEHRLFASLLNGAIESDFIAKERRQFQERYFKDPVVRKYVRLMIDRLLEQGRYEDLILLLEPLSEQLGGECYLKSVLALSYVRSGKIARAEEIVEKIGKCDDPWYTIALHAIKDAQLQQEVYNVGKDR
ncbi:MAG: hypothetical protein C6I00_04980 [Nitratiruptor sp.]|nr:hypothetical protein [Nitratiruptor sp.]NPA84264.1 hypothetical protein [Campylobacterota bacterium]